ncbi:MAG: hypothetical protein QXO76_04195 [Thermoproteota archaeon]
MVRVQHTVSRADYENSVNEFVSIIERELADKVVSVFKTITFWKTCFHHYCYLEDKLYAVEKFGS